MSASDSWVPTSDEPLFILAMDHRTSFAKDLFGRHGYARSRCLVKMRQAKALVYEGLRHVAARPSADRVSLSTRTTAQTLPEGRNPTVSSC